MSLGKRPVTTYSIAAYDPQTGELGIAVQSHYFAVGALVPTAMAGVGAIVTQSFAEPQYGLMSLKLLQNGKTPSEVLAA